MRISKVAILVALLGGCNRPATVDVPEADRVDCAMANAEAFSRDCSIERTGDGATFTLRHADGGFRRFAAGADGSVTTADGADVAATQRIADGRLEIKVGADRYRLPPTK